MPRPVERGQRYIPAFDGIRALAVLAVIAYHINVPGAQGGMLGVGVFFTLSGYLITDLLLAHWDRFGNLGLGTFWLRRARRLLPALFLMLIVVSVWVAVFDAGQLAQVRRQVIAAALYVGNWSTIAQHGSYFSRFAAPLPLDHLWSLAIEEQFYLVWPWLLLLGVRVVRSRRRLALLALLGAAASAFVMGHLYHPGYDPTRVYEGTDTRAFALLIGAALAMVRPSRTAGGAAGPSGRVRPRWPGHRRPGRDRGPDLEDERVLDVPLPVGVRAALGGDRGVCRGGREPSQPARARSSAGGRCGGSASAPTASTCGSGRSSCSRTRTRPGSTVLRAAPEVAGTLLIASLSWKYVEEPIRQGALGRLWRRFRSHRAGSDPAGARRRSRASPSRRCSSRCSAWATSSPSPRPASASARPTRRHASLSASVKSRRVAQGGPGHHPPAKNGAAALATPPRPAQIVMSVGRLHRRLDLRGRDLNRLHPESEATPAGAARRRRRARRSIRRSRAPDRSSRPFEGFPNAATVALEHVRRGSTGCWILALGTNDVDNVAGGGVLGWSAGSQRMMSIIGNQPVLWVDLIALLQLRPLPGVLDAGLEQGPAQPCCALPQHARVRLGRPREDEMVHPRRHPLLLPRLRGADP